MDADVKKAWVDALRSGEYKQGQGQLCQLPGGGPKHCCLGVLVDLYVKSTGLTPAQHVDGRIETGWEGWGVPSQDVLDWAGLTESNPEVTVGEEYPDRTSLAGLNDRGKGFDVIADLIEAQL